ncbi:unnamed protein product [Urochloa humidicola]
MDAGMRWSGEAAGPAQAGKGKPAACEAVEQARPWVLRLELRDAADGAPLPRSRFTLVPLPPTTSSEGEGEWDGGGGELRDELGPAREHYPTGPC